ncbi:MAG: gamma-glutamyl-gamma-aminobutyrate hydrolase family protein [Oligoflexia bacterium]|nr:gamma-glutamyl-gamma-aminobutyrate hydrolase family protein [Oligoflexia bacterium]
MKKKKEGNEMKDMLKIGLSSGFIYPKKDTASPKGFLKVVEDMYSFVVQAGVGVLPIAIPNLDIKYLKKIIQELDGVILTGGDDVAPKNYGERAIDPVRWPGDPRRDEYEFMVIDLAIKYGKPILAICRGCQILNVYFGGSLYQDLPSQFSLSEFTNEEIVPVPKHRDYQKFDRIKHRVDLVAGGILDYCYRDRKKDSILVNSVHHQGIKVLGKGLKVEALSVPDGLIEAYSHANDKKNSKNSKYPFILGVQWHPEYTHTIAKQLSDPFPILKRFCKECRECKK